MPRPIRVLRSLRRRLAGVAAATALALIVVAPASAASVLNGGFETGTLEGWSLSQSNPGVAWVPLNAAAAAATQPQMRFPPIEGAYSAYTEESGAGTAILYQDVALDPNTTDLLKLAFGYTSEGGMVTPVDGSLDSEGAFPNQQLRIDVTKPTAPLESVAPEDILRSVFATQTGSTRELAPRTFTADLSPFAGQTVRLRLAMAGNGGQLNAIVDSVSIASGPIPPPPMTPTPEPPAPPIPSNAFADGRLALNKKSGSGVLTVDVPGAGTLIATDARRKVAVASRRRKEKAKPIYVRTAAVESGGAEVLRVPIRPTPAALRLLRRRGTLPVRLTLTFTPAGGAAATQAYSGKLVRLRPPPAPR